MLQEKPLRHPSSGLPQRLPRALLTLSASDVLPAPPVDLPAGGQGCRGQITAVIACRTDPGTTLVLKGNRPLELRWHPRRKAVLYASDPAYLDAVLAEEKGWRELPVPPMSLVVFRRENLAGRCLNLIR